MACERRQALAHGVALAHQHERGGAVGDRRSVAGRDRPAVAEHRTQLRQPACIALARRLVLAELAATLERDRRDFVAESAFGHRRLRPQQAFERIRVLRFAADAARLGCEVGVVPHEVAFVRVLEPIAVHVVEQLPVAQPVAVAATRHDVRRVRHRLHAARDRDVARAGQQQVVREHHGLHAGAAHLAQGRRRCRRGQARAEHCLRSRC
ncbi:hypothetical protein AWV80_41440 [Cupriavidus sp. UYMU48A]|nr:hypothetical protein AWV80_31340 [Cupriavidus sp. UYMU48A]KAF7964147.1 hypothetical protein AWV80_41440 [Cupriavidus sp. UYMU48A]